MTVAATMPGVQLGQRRGRRLGQHTEVARLTDFDGLRPARLIGPAQKHRQSRSAPRHIRRPPGRRRWAWCACTAARIAAHGSPRPNGISVDSATAHIRLQQRSDPPELSVLGGGNLGEVLIAALGNEIGLSHHGDARARRGRPDCRHRHHRGVLDAIARMAAGRTQGRDGHHQLGCGHAVHGHRLAAGVLVGDPLGQGRPGRDGRRAGFSCPATRKPRRWPEFAAAMCHQQRHHVIGVEIGCGVGDPGDAGRGEAPTQFGQIGFAALQRVRTSRDRCCAGGRRGVRPSRPGPTPRS